MTKPNYRVLIAEMFTKLITAKKRELPQVRHCAGYYFLSLQSKPSFYISTLSVKQLECLAAVNALLYINWPPH